MARLLRAVSLGEAEQLDAMADCGDAHLLEQLVREVWQHVALEVVHREQPRIEPRCLIAKLAR